MTISSPQQQSSSSQAITAFVLSILSLVCCQLLGPIGWYLGNQEVKAIREGRSPAAGEGLAQAAVIMGIIGTILLALGVIWIFFLGGMAVLGGLSGAAGS